MIAKPPETTEETEIFILFIPQTACQIISLISPQEKSYPSHMVSLTVFLLLFVFCIPLPPTPFIFLPGTDLQGVILPYPLCLICLPNTRFTEVQ
ncbi:hypothetical protein FKM82_018875 [Ascaphus truei]